MSLASGWTYLLTRGSQAARGTFDSAWNWAPIVGIGIVGFLWGGPLEGETTLEQIAVTLIYTAAAWLAFFLWRLLFRVPYDDWIEKQRLVDELRSEIVGLREPNKPLQFSYSHDNQSSEWSELHMILVHVTNHSTRTIDNVQVELMSYRDFRHEIPVPVRRKCISTEDQLAVSINPSETKSFRLIGVNTNLTDAEAVGLPGRPPAVWLPRADYEFVVSVTGRDVATPDSTIYDLQFAGQHGYLFGPGLALLPDEIAKEIQAEVEELNRTPTADEERQGPRPA